MDPEESVQALPVEADDLAPPVGEVLEQVAVGEGGDPSDLDLAELAALEAVEHEAEAERETVLAATRAALEQEREATREAVRRYREVVLAAEPDLPGDLVVGETLGDLDASLVTARRAVAQIRARITDVDGDAGAPRAFPVGAPPRRGRGTSGLSGAAKIAQGLADRRGARHG